MKPQVIHNVIKGFSLRKGSSVALNYWGNDETLMRNIEKALRSLDHEVIVHQVDLNDIKQKAQADALFLDEETLSRLVAGENALDVFSHPVMLPKDFPKDKMVDYKMYLGKMFQAMKSNKEKFIQWRLPTKENASTIDPTRYVDAMEKASMVNYEALRKRAFNVENFVKNKKQVRIIANKTDITLSVEGSKWFKDVGDGDVPAGEIACVPHLAFANGTLHVPYVAFKHIEFKALDFTIIDGVFHTNNESFNSFLEKFSGDYNILAEFGIGLNDEIKALIGDQLHDEKKLHTVHLGIGTNTMFGGPNKSDLHLDLVIEPTTVLMDEVPLIKDGELTVK